MTTNAPTLAQLLWSLEALIIPLGQVRQSDWHRDLGRAPQSCAELYHIGANNKRNLTANGMSPLFPYTIQGLPSRSSFRKSASPSSKNIPCASLSLRSSGVSFWDSQRATIRQRFAACVMDSAMGAHSSPVV